MPKFEIDIQGKKFEVDAPNEQALPEIVDTISKQENIGIQTGNKPQNRLQSFINTAPQRAEQRITERPSIIADLIKDPSTLQRFKQHPLGTSLRTLGGAYEYAEGVPADVLYNLDKPQNIVPDIIKTFKGERPAQVGDFLTKGGLPEPFAAVGGLLATGIRGTPTAALGAITAKAISPVTSALKYAIGKVGKPAIANTMRFLTGKIPIEHAERALENPEILSPKLLAIEGEKAGNLYKTVIQPIRDNPKALVNLSNVKDRILQENLQTKFGEPSPELSKMSSTEQTKIKDWIANIMLREKGNVKTTFNRVEGMINEIDASLGKFYKGKEKALLTGREPISKPFERMATIIRGSLSNTLKEQYPEAVPVIEQYHNYILNRQAAESFKDITPSFFKGLPAKVGLLALGMKSPVAAVATMPLTIPATWKGLIRGGGGASKTLSEHPEYMYPFLRKELTKNAGE